jgi:hypothetical protein
VKLGATAKITGGGEVPVTLAVKAKIEVEVAGAYERVVEAAQERLDSITMAAAPGTHVIYVIGSYEQIFTSVVEYNQKSQKLTLPYTFILDVPKIDDSLQEPCGEKTQPDATQTPEPILSTPPTSSYQPGMECFDLLLNKLDGKYWCEVTPGGLSFTDGSLQLTANSDEKHEIHPCTGLDDRLKFVELDAQVLDGRGEKHYTGAGIGVSLGGERYAFLYLDAQGNAFMYAGEGDKPPRVIEDMDMGGRNIRRKLRIEYTGSDVVFSVDGHPFSYREPYTGTGSWFLLSVRAYPNTVLTAEFLEVRWGREK